VLPLNIALSPRRLREFWKRLFTDAVYQREASIAEPKNPNRGDVQRIQCRAGELVMNPTELRAVIDPRDNLKINWSFSIYHFSFSIWVVKF
jgi:hypothetical protein